MQNETKPLPEVRSQDGVCPHCHYADGPANVGAVNYLFCDEHRVIWCVGANCFPGWRYETEEQQRLRWEAVADYEEVTPIYPPEYYEKIGPDDPRRFG